MGIVPASVLAKENATLRSYYTEHVFQADLPKTKNSVKQRRIKGVLHWVPHSSSPVANTFSEAFQNESSSTRTFRSKLP